MTHHVVDLSNIAAVPPLRHSNISPVETGRIRELAKRAIAGAPALTPGEVRELACSIEEHNQAFAAYPV
jgi:hypothetical protein